MIMIRKMFSATKITVPQIADLGFSIYESMALGVSVSNASAMAAPTSYFSR